MNRRVKCQFCAVEKKVHGLLMDEYEMLVCPKCGHLDLFAEVESPVVEAVEPPPGRDWKCPLCNEIVPGNFAICWNCQNPYKS